MPRLVWDAAGTRLFEVGLDRGVLYVPGQAGVAWSGLVSVPETPSGGGARPYYQDGIKYLNLAEAEEFEATINAFAAPPEFGPCDGTAKIHNGLYATQQARKQFGLSYRTRLGNDTNGVDFGYKIHLVYNALAGPSERSYSSAGDSAEPIQLSWPITTLPPTITGYKRTAHLVIDSTQTAPAVLSEIEDILYGTASVAPALPTPNEIIAIFA